MYLYQQRILALEKEFSNARRNLNRLQRLVRFKPDSVRKAAVKTQLDLVNALIRLTKEETAFFVRLGQQYDFSRFGDEFVDMLRRRDPELAMEILLEIDGKWKKQMTR